jgi:hypothetical protein
MVPGRGLENRLPHPVAEQSASAQDPTHECLPGASEGFLGPAEDRQSNSSVDLPGRPLMHDERDLLVPHLASVDPSEQAAETVLNGRETEYQLPTGRPAARVCLDERCGFSRISAKSGFGKRRVGVMA